MARKAKHDQSLTPATGWTCEKCRLDDCGGCLDVLRNVWLGKAPICQCKKSMHAEKVELEIRLKVEAVRANG